MFVAGASAATAVKAPLSGEELEEELVKIRAEYARLHYTAQCSIVDHVHDELRWKDGEFAINYSHENTEAIYFNVRHFKKERSIRQGILGGEGSYFVRVFSESKKLIG